MILKNCEDILRITYELREIIWEFPGIPVSPFPEFQRLVSTGNFET